MALKRSSERSENRAKFPFASAYFRILDVSNSKDGSGNLNIRVAGYADEEARKMAADAGGNQPPMPGGAMDGRIYEKNFTISRAALNSFEIPTGTKPADVDFAVAYLWLKSQPDFASAQDC